MLLFVFISILCVYTISNTIIITATIIIIIHHHE